MPKSIRQLGLLVSVQLLCVAVGLFMHHQFIRYAIRDGAEKAAWSEMNATAIQLHAKLTDLGWAPDGVDETAIQRARELLVLMHPTVGEGTIVDRHWRVVTTSLDSQKSHKATPEKGSETQWSDAKHTLDGTMASVIRGEFRCAGQSYLASACRLENNAGFVVAHRAVADIETQTAALAASLPMLGGIALLWIAALLAVVDYLVLTRITDKAYRERTLANNENLRRTQNLTRTRDAVIFGLAKLADSRDPETGDHLERISIYSAVFAEALHKDPRYAEIVTPTFISVIRISSVLHDIGKVGIEDAILRKTEALDESERTRMQKHTAIGGECLREIERRLGGSNFLQMAREIALAHHEKWNGTGYPHGLAGNQIPLAARIVAIADAYDALASKRVYKSPFSHDKCVEIIREQAGKHFDPELVEIWLSIEAKFRQAALQYADPSRPDPESTLNVEIPGPGHADGNTVVPTEETVVVKPSATRTDSSAV